MREGGNHTACYSAWLGVWRASCCLVPFSMFVWREFFNSYFLLESSKVSRKDSLGVEARATMLQVVRVTRRC